MITNFENITAPLSEEEHLLVPIIIRNMKKYTSANPIKEPQIVAGMKMHGHKFSGALLRKLVNHIRGNGLAAIIATSKGYFTSDDNGEILQQIQSMRDRASAMMWAAAGLEKLVNLPRKLNPKDEEEEESQMRLDY